MADEAQKVETQRAEYAFVIVKQKDGRYAISHIDNDEIDRQPTLDDIYGALSVILRDMNVQQTAIATAQAIQQFNGGSQKKSDLVIPQKKFVKRS